jgi:hypothetical protein
MTRKQFRKWKQQNKINKAMESQISSERPEWADEEKIDNSFQTWRENFLAELRDVVNIRLKEPRQFNY